VTESPACLTLIRCPPPYSLLASAVLAPLRQPRAAPPQPNHCPQDLPWHVQCRAFVRTLTGGTAPMWNTTIFLPRSASMTHETLSAAIMCVQQKEINTYSESLFISVVCRQFSLLNPRPFSTSFIPNIFSCERTLSIFTIIAFSFPRCTSRIILAFIPFGSRMTPILWSFKGLNAKKEEKYSFLHQINWIFDGRAKCSMMQVLNLAPCESPCCFLPHLCFVNGHRAGPGSFRGYGTPKRVPWCPVASQSAVFVDAAGSSGVCWCVRI